MSTNCTVCNHEYAAEIDVGIRAGTAILALQRQYGPSRHAITRHRDAGHVSATLSAAGEGGDATDLDALESRVLGVLTRAEKTGSGNVAVNASRELRLLYAERAKLQGSGPAKVVSYTEDPDFLRTRDALVEALADGGACGCRARVVAALLATGEGAAS